MIVTSEYFSGASVATVCDNRRSTARMEVAWFAEFSAPQSFGFNHYVHTLEQSRLLYVYALVLCEAPVKPSGISFVRRAKRDALPLAVAQLELIPHVVFVRTFAHVAAAFLPNALWTLFATASSHYKPLSAGLPLPRLTLQRATQDMDVSGLVRQLRSTNPLGPGQTAIPGSCWAPGRPGHVGLTGGLHRDVFLGAAAAGGLFGKCHIHGQDALVVAGLDVLFVGACRQGDRAGK